MSSGFILPRPKQGRPRAVTMANADDHTLDPTVHRGGNKKFEWRKDHGPDNLFGGCGSRRRVVGACMAYSKAIVVLG